MIAVSRGMSKRRLPTSRPQPEEAERLESADDLVKMGQWFWLPVGDPDEGIPYVDTLVCCTAIGTNYAEVKSPGGMSWRIHMNEFDKELRPESDPRKVIAGNVSKHQRQVGVLLDEVRAVTARLGVSPRVGIPEKAQQEQSLALATLSEATDIKGYQTALERAKDEELPALFEAIKEKFFTRTRSSRSGWPRRCCR